MPRLRLETQDRDKDHESGLNEWSENMITMPVLSVHGRDAVQLLTLEALLNPPRPLAVRLEFEG